MAVPLRQSLRVGWYIVQQRLRRNARYPLVLMLESLFRCNLACAGCGKIDYPDPILNRRLSVDECLSAVDECGAPVVSIPGGEPLLHKEIDKIVAGIVARKKFVYLCTNALLLKEKIDQFTPSKYLTFSVHMDGQKEHHDFSVCREGGYDIALEGIREAVNRGFRVTTGETVEGIERCVQTFAYWNPRILDATHLLNPQTGDYVPVQVLPLGRDSIGRHTDAQRYRLIGDSGGKPLRIDLWYSPAREWLALESRTPDGRTLRYSQE